MLTGAAGGCGPMMNVDAAAWDKTFEVNVKGYFAATREVVRHLYARNAPGAIVNVASVAGLMGSPLQGVYGMTKAAVISMTRTLAMELGTAGIRVNAIAPGYIETDLNREFLRSPAGQAMQARLVVGEHVCRNRPAPHEAGAVAQVEQGPAPVAE